MSNLLYAIRIMLDVYIIKQKNGFTQAFPKIPDERNTNIIQRNQSICLCLTHFIYYTLFSKNTRFNRKNDLHFKIHFYLLFY